MIYFAQLPTGSIKIGYSADPAWRLRYLASHYKRPLSLLRTIRGGRNMEQRIHEKFAHLRFGQTEQFRPAPDLMEFIGRPLFVIENVEAVMPIKVIGPRRRYFKTSVILDRETLDHLQLIRQRLPHVESLSCAVRYVGRIAVKHLPKESS